MSGDQSEYIIDKIDFTADRLGSAEVLNIKKIVSELNIFESVELPYLTATMLMPDSLAFKSTIGIKGSERVSIHLKANVDAPVKVKHFMITGIAKEISINEKTDVRAITMIEEHAYLSTLKKFSKSYTGVPSTILFNILRGHLDKNLTEEDAANASQGKMKVNIPYWTALQSVEWIRDRMSTSSGSPYFLYCTLRDDDIKLADLQTIMFKSPWNDGTPYTFTQTAHNQTVDKNDQLRKLFYVKNHKQTSIESALRLAQTGAVGSDYKVMDLTSGSQLPDTFHSGIVTLEAFVKDLGVNESLGLAIDSGLQIGSSSQGEKRSVDGYPSKSFSSVVASRQFYDDDGKPIHGYHDESLKSSMYKLKVKSAALRTILMNNVYTITVPGQPYLLDETAGVGSNIYLNYAAPSTASGEGASNAENIDRQRSGKFLVYKARHQFSAGQYDVHMEIVKLTGQKQ